MSRVSVRDALYILEVSMNNSFIEDCKRSLLDNGLIPDEIIADGAIHRCGTAEKPHGKDGAYIIHPTPPYSLWWQNWRTGESGTQSAKNDALMTSSERKAFNERIHAEKVLREKGQEQLHSNAAQKAAYIWKNASPASNEHPYLLQKGVTSFGLRLGKDNTLIVPVLDSRGILVSLQFISSDGSAKFFLKDGRTQGGYYTISNPNSGNAARNIVCIAEGYATAASIHMATGHSVVMAFNAQNLQTVAQIIRAKNPDQTIIICADNDINNNENIGVIKATCAAIAAQAFIALPPVVNGNNTDFNDLHAARGLDAVKICIEKAKVPDAEQEEYEPTPLRCPQEKPKGYPTDALGDFSQFVELVAKYVGAPISMVASSVLATLSLCTQGFANVEHEGRVIPLSLYCLTIAESGDRKSSVDAIVSTAVRNYEQEQCLQYKEAIRAWNVDTKTYEITKKNIEKEMDRAKIHDHLMTLGEAPERPMNPRILISNTNVEGLYRLFLEGRSSLGLFSDEAGILFGGTSFNQENKLKSISFFTSIWSNGCVDKIRMGEGESQISDKRLASHLMLQPVVAKTLFADQLLQGQGFFPRFLVAYPKSLKGTRTKGDTPFADIRQEAAVQSFYQTCTQLLQKDIEQDGNGNIYFRAVTLSPEAERVYRELYNVTEVEQSEQGKFATISNYASRCVNANE